MWIRCSFYCSYSCKMPLALHSRHQWWLLKSILEPTLLPLDTIALCSGHHVFLNESCFRWPSPESELRQKSSEHYHLMFLRANFQDLLELLQDSEGLLSGESVRALGFVFSAAKNSQECPLYELAVSAASHSGYSMVSVLHTEFALSCTIIPISLYAGQQKLFLDTV